MKNSNKILLVAIMALIIATLIYNLSLKAEYLAEYYKNPYRYAKSLNVKNFNTIHNKAGNIFDVIVKKDMKYDVKISSSRSIDDLNIYVKDSTLVIDVKDSLSTIYAIGPEVIVFCPEIKQLQVEAPKTSYYNSEKKLVIDYEKKRRFSTVLEGFKLRDLRIIQGRENTVKLKNNTIRTLTSTIGGLDQKGADLEIGSDNKIESAYFHAYNQDHLSLLNPQIKQGHFDFTDSAKVTLTGVSLGLLKNKQP